LNIQILVTIVFPKFYFLWIFTTTCPKDHLKNREQERAQNASVGNRLRALSAKELDKSSKRMSTPNKIGRLRYRLRAGQTESYDSVTEVKNIYGDFTKF
jgi:hypothetical protein